MNGKKNRQAVILVSLIVAATLLLTLLVIGTVGNSRIHSMLEDLRDRLEATATPIEPPVKEPVKTVGYSSLASGRMGAGCLYYFGDDSFYGRGTGGALGVKNTASTPNLLHQSLTAAYTDGGRINGRLLQYTNDAATIKTHTTEEGLSDYLTHYSTYGYDFRLAIVMPSDRTIEENRATAERDGYRGSLSGEAGKDIEALVRTIRERTPRCDILLAVQHTASATLAEAILAVGEHYGLKTVDLRQIAGQIPTHEDGEDAGYPTADGHRRIAEALAAAIQEAAEGGHFSQGVPSTKLY